MLFGCAKCRQKIDADTVPASGVCSVCLTLPDMAKFVSLEDHGKLRADHDRVTLENKNLKAEAEAHGIKGGAGKGGDATGENSGGETGDHGKSSGKKGSPARIFGTVFNLFTDPDEVEAKEKGK